MVKTKNLPRHTRPVRHDPALSRKIILGVIILAILIVAGFTTYSLIFTNEHAVKSLISDLATDYYENYFYENLISSPSFQNLDDVDAAMEKYHSTGLTPVTLNDLLLYDDEKNYQHHDYLTKYCDPDATYVIFYVDPPYSRISYRAEYTYACNF